MITRQKCLWLTDTHTKYLGRYELLNTIHDQKPVSVFHSGDMSEGFAYLSDLEFIGKRIGRPFYFSIGNHEIWGSSFANVHAGVRRLCKQYRNLIWMNDAGIVPLNEETALIGCDGWYDARVGNTDYLKYTFDWFMIKDFRDLPNMKVRIEKFRDLADESAKLMTKRLEEAVETYKTIFMLTHVPIAKEANRANSWLSETFWTPYNTNYALGQAVEKVMEKHKKRHLTVLSGHVHSASTILMSRNVECRVGKGSYYHISDDEVLYI